jgi:hypothetical protein
MRRLLVPFLALALVLSGCASLTGGGKGEVTDAIKNLDTTEGVTATFTLQSDPASLAALGADSGDQLSAEDAQKILDSSITVSGRQGENPMEGTAQISANIAGLDNAVELRFVDKTLYFRADARGLVEMFGQDPAMLDQAAAQAAAAGMDFVGPVINGEWIAVTGFEQFAQQFGGMQAQQTKDVNLFAGLADVIDDEGDVDEEGSDDAGTHYVVSIPLRDAYERFIEEFQGLAGSQLPPGAIPPADQVPNEDLPIDMWVDGDRVTRIEIDFLKLEDVMDEDIPDGVERFAFRVDLGEFDGNIEVPEGATEVNFQQLFQGMMGGMMGASGAGAATSAGGKQGEFPCELLKGEDEQMQALYYDECPELKND